MKNIFKAKTAKKLGNVNTHRYPYKNKIVKEIAKIALICDAKNIKMIRDRKMLVYDTG